MIKKKVLVKVIERFETEKKEIKFRVRNPDTKKIVAYEWVKGGRWHHQIILKNGEHMPIEMGICGFHFPREQFIGIINRNKQEIYEGDILKGILNPNHYVRREEDRFIAIRLIKGEEWAYEAHETDVVVGDIYQNPELLEEA